MDVAAASCLRRAFQDTGHQLALAVAGGSGSMPSVAVVHVSYILAEYQLDEVYLLAGR